MRRRVFHREGRHTRNHARDRELDPLLPARELPRFPPARRVTARGGDETVIESSDRIRASIQKVVRRRRPSATPPPADLDSTADDARQRIAALHRGFLRPVPPMTATDALRLFTDTHDVAVVDQLFEAGFGDENWLFVALFKRDRKLMILKRLLDRFGGTVIDRYQRNLFGHLVAGFDEFGRRPDAERTLLLIRLAEAKVDPNHRDGDGWTPLERLVAQHRFGILRSWLIDWLVDNGADPNGGPGEFERGGPIFRAIGRAGMYQTTGEIAACAATIDELIRHGADPKVTTRHGRNPVTVALDTLGELTVADELIREHGVKPELLNTAGENVLFGDLWTGAAQFLSSRHHWDWLKSRGVPFDVPDLIGSTPFDHLLLKSSDWHLSYASWLVDFGVSPFTPMSNGVRPIDHLKQHGELHLIEHHPRVKGAVWIEAISVLPKPEPAAECVICLTAPTAELIRLQPCSHRCICFDCLADLKGATSAGRPAICPICRAPIGSVVTP